MGETMSDDTMESLRQAFMKENDNKTDCSMAEMTTAYAFGELGSEEATKVKEHLHTCRHCLELYMDIKVAEDDAENVKNQKVEVLPGLQRAIDKGKKPRVSIFNQIGAAISDFFSQGFTLKPVATFATVLLVVAAGIYLVKNQEGITPFTIEMAMQGKVQAGFRGGEPEYNEVQVKPGEALKSGDYFRFQTTIDKDAFVYIVFQDSAGNINSLEKGHIAAGTSFILPDMDKWYQLDKNTGTEKIYLLASEKKIEDFADRIEKLKSGGIDTIGKVFPKATIKAFSFEHR
jgi:hypothetical protein